MRWVEVVAHKPELTLWMNSRLYEDEMIKPATKSLRKTPRRVFRELEIVRLKRPFQSSSGVIPQGTAATILQVFDNAYQVEFEGSHEEPETLPANLVEENATT